MKLNSSLILILLFTQFNLFCQIPKNDLKGYWPFNGNANEFLKNINNGNVLGPILTSDRCGNMNCAYEFNGISDYIQCSKDSLEIKDKISISLWFKKNSLGDGADIAVSKFSVFSFDTGYNIQFDMNGAPEIRGRDMNNQFSQSENDNVSRLDNEWLHLVGIVDRSLWSIYLDTELIGSFDNGHTNVDIGASTTNLTFGRRSSESTTLPWNHYKGSLDDILIYNRVLSQEEIEILYNLDCKIQTENFIEYDGCIGDNYQIEVNGNLYNENNSSGLEIIQLNNCADSVIYIELNYFPIHESDIILPIEECEDFSININGTLYDDQNKTGIEVLKTIYGCDSIVNVQLIYDETQEECNTYIPNIINRFSNINNSFKLYSKSECKIKIEEFEIYDRWGNKVFSNTLDPNWNGKLNGKYLEQGVYAYKIKYINVCMAVTKIGTVIIL